MQATGGRKNCFDRFFFLDAELPKTADPPFMVDYGPEETAVTIRPGRPDRMEDRNNTREIEQWPTLK